MSLGRTQPPPVGTQTSYTGAHWVNPDSNPLKPATEEVAKVTREQTIKKHLNSSLRHHEAASGYAKKWIVAAGAAMTVSGVLAPVGIPCLLISLGGFIKNKLQAYRHADKADKAMKTQPVKGMTIPNTGDYRIVEKQVKELRERCQKHKYGKEIWDSAQKHITRYIKKGETTDLTMLINHLRFARYDPKNISITETPGGEVWSHGSDVLCLNKRRTREAPPPKKNGFNPPGMDPNDEEVRSKPYNTNVPHARR